MRPLILPEYLSRSAARLMEPPPGMAFDFAEPPGAPALIDAHSISWRIFKNPVSLFIGGVAAVILELAEPAVRAGVWDHSSFRKDAVMRLRRTGFAAMMTVYGPRADAEAMIARVVRMHDRVRGETDHGDAYHANDPRLLDWVQATASFGFIEAYHRYARRLSPDQRSQAFAEGAAAARLYGATGAPQSLSQWDALLETTSPALERSDIVFEFLDILRGSELLPRPARPIQHLLIRAAVDMTPAPIRARLGLEDQRLHRPERAVVRALGRAADKIVLSSAPPARASLRMGLPLDHLYRTT